ncbi:MAG TPA: BON domain-containing protein [Thermoanaerobaculia bacterium]|nr:BON domain-containing protein [Thermoanaerobaculia bacterium]
MTRKQTITTAAAFAMFLTTAAFAQKHDAPQATDLTPQFRSAALPIANLRVWEIGGIVLIRGEAIDRAVAQQAGVLATSLGYSRVANLVSVVAPPDDAKIQRAAERELSRHRSLDGCKLSVDSKQGVVHVAGTVAEADQKDEVVTVLRTVDGVRDVRAELLQEEPR